MMMAYPKQYEGKIVRMEGIYYPAYYQKGERYCQYCIIRDASACCAQGMEFIWGDGTHQYPDEYPDENSEIEVEGIFETYKEDGDDSLHVRLKDAKLTVLSETY